MFNKLDHIESLIADSEARIKVNKDLIRQYKKSLKRKKNILNYFINNKLSESNINLIREFIKQDEEAIKFYTRSLREKEAGLKKLKIEKFAALGKKFKVVKGGSSQ